MNIVVNIVLMAVSLPYLLVIAASCILHKNRKKANVPFLYMIAMVTVLILFQLLAWCIDLANLYGLATPWMMRFNRFQLVEDYVVYYGHSIAITFFVTSVINAVAPMPEKTDKLIKDIQFFLIILGIGLSCAFCSSLWSGYFYILDEAGNLTYQPSYDILLLASLLPELVTIILPIIYRKELGMKKVLLFASYVVFPMAALPIDVKYNLAISYTLSAFIMLVMYIGIELEFDNDLLKKEVELTRKEKEMSEMRMNMLLSQIHPHFLFNALASISILCTIDPPKAARATRDFSNYLKGNLKSINAKEPIPFSEELAHVENYLKIQKLRFDERMEVIFNIQEEEFLIPALALQTLVENSVRHGVQERLEMTTIWISTVKENGWYVISVKDDGPGFDKNQPLATDRPHIGLSSTRERLVSMVNGTFEIETEIGKGTTAVIRIPDPLEDYI